jgi:hypothetical protein
MEIAKITASPEVQPRVALHYPTVESYCEAIRRGDELPPVRVFFDGETHWLTRGFHRLEAYKLHGSVTIPTDVRNGTFQEAILDATESNGDHGLERSQEDLARAIEMTKKVTMELGQKWTQEAIAQHCHCSQQRVSQVLGNTRTSNSPARSEKRSAVERALEAKPNAPAREVARDLEAKGVKVDHKTVQAVREEKARREAEPKTARAEAPAAESTEATTPAIARVPVERLPRPEDFPTKSHRDVIIAMRESIRIARGFDAKHWEMAVRIIQHEIAVREHGAKETA